MIRKTYILSVMILIAALFLTSCTNTIDTTTIPENKLCSVDTDCVPASCCHVTKAVNINSAPKCEGMLCTAECVAETLDCGQGEVKCVKGECKVVMK